MKTQKVKGRLDRIVKTGVSYYGNPHAWIVVVTDNGNVIRGRTCTNGSIGYALENGGVGERARTREWEFHETRTGNIIFDYVKES